MTKVNAWDCSKAGQQDDANANRLVHISFEQMLSEMFDCIVNYKEYPTYYWYHQDNGYIEVIECDLYRGRIYMADGDFSEFDWELKESRLYKEAII